MRRFWVGCVAALALCWAGAAEAAAKVEDEFMAIAKAVSDGKCDVRRIRKFIDRAEFGDLTGPARSVIWSALAMCDPASQHEAALKAVAEPDAPALAFSLRFADAVERKEMTEALAALHTAVERKDDETLIWFDDRHVYDLARSLEDDEAGFRRLMADLERADWPQDKTYYGGDWLWARYAGLLAAGGDNARASRIAARIEDPGELARMSLDNRFDGIVEIYASRFDLAAAAERRATHDRELLAKAPRDGSALSELALMLRLLGRQEEALALLDGVLAKSGPIRNYQGEEHRNWILNDRALVLLDLGRHDEAVAGMAAAARLKEGGKKNVSQTINLSGLQNAAGRFEAALGTLAPIEAGSSDNMSPYGAMWVQAERSCALIKLGRSAEAAKTLAFTADHAKDNWNARIKALLCANELDALAALYKARLADPSERGDALLELARFKPPPARSPFDLELGARMDALRARADVQAAVAAVGRMRELPIQAGSLIDSY